MQILSQSHVIPTHIISGFLGAGKTTLLKSLLNQKPKHEKWAVLMNEFGQIGVDQEFIQKNENIDVQELLGGCLCCTTQLPMQIALAKILSQIKPDRLFIEPTGLGHPAQLVEQLSEPHWQTHLSLRQVITVIDGSKLNQALWSKHQIYADQLQAAQIIVISHQDLMQAEDEIALQQLQEKYQNYGQIWLKTTQGQLDLAQIDRVYIMPKQKKQLLLSVQQTQKPTENDVIIKTLPYHYVDFSQDYYVAGWKLPQNWQFLFHDLFDLLSEQKNWLRIKAIFHTDEGWKAFNFNPEQFNYQNCEASIDNRIEIIYQHETQWLEFEQALLACRY